MTLVEHDFGRTYQIYINIYQKSKACFSTHWQTTTDNVATSATLHLLAVPTNVSFYQSHVQLESGFLQNVILRNTILPKSGSSNVMFC
jgi:hypothetical protein